MLIAADLRNSRVSGIVRELCQFGVQSLVHGPLGDLEEARRENGIDLLDREEMQYPDDSPRRRHSYPQRSVGAGTQQ